MFCFRLSEYRSHFPWEHLAVLRCKSRIWTNVLCDCFHLTTYLEYLWSSGKISTQVYLRNRMDRWSHERPTCITQRDVLASNRVTLIDDLRRTNPHCAFLLYNSFIAFEACFARVLTEEDVESPTARTRNTRSRSMHYQSPPTAVTGIPFSMSTSTGNIAASTTPGRVSPVRRRTLLFYARLWSYFGMNQLSNAFRKLLISSGPRTRQILTPPPSESHVPGRH